MDILTLKQEAAKLAEPDRRELSLFLIRLGQETAAWRKEMARRMKRMDAGHRVSLAAFESTSFRLPFPLPSGKGRT